MATAPAPAHSHALVPVPPGSPAATTHAHAVADRYGPAAANDIRHQVTADPHSLRPPPKLKANATHLLAGDVSQLNASDLISPPPSTLASLTSTPNGSELLSFDLNLELPPIPMLRTRGETVTSDTQQRMLLQRQSTAVAIADHDMRPDSELMGRYSMLDYPLQDGYGAADAQAQSIYPKLAVAQTDAATDTLDGTHRQYPLLTPAPSYSFDSTSYLDGSSNANLPTAVLDLPPPPPPPAPRSATSSPNAPISPAASFHLTTAFAFDPTSTLLASAIPLPESPAVDSGGRASLSDSVFARAFGFESNADPAFVPTPELLPNSNAPPAPSALAARATVPSPNLAPISASVFPSAISFASSADHPSSSASTVRPNQSAATANSFLDQTPTQSLTPQPQPRNSMPGGIAPAANAEIGSPFELQVEDDYHSRPMDCPTTSSFAFPSPPSPATIFGDSIENSGFLNDSAYSGTVLSEPVPRLSKLSTAPTPSTETLATRRNAPSLRLSSSSPCSPQSETDQQVRAQSPTLVQQDVPLDSAVVVSTTASSSSSAASISDKRLHHELGDQVRLDDAITDLPLSPRAASIASTCSTSSRTLKRSKGCDQLSKHYSPTKPVVVPSASNTSMASDFGSLPPLTLPTLAPLSPLAEPNAPNPPPLDANAINVTPTSESHPTGSPGPRSPPRLAIPPPPVPLPATPHSPTAASFASTPRRRSVPARQEMRASYAASSIYQLQAFLDSISDPPVGELPPLEIGEPLSLASLGVQPTHGSGKVPAAVVVVPETRDQLEELNRKIDLVADEVVELERVLMTVAEDESEDDDGEVARVAGLAEDEQAKKDGSVVGHQRTSTLSVGGEDGTQLGKKKSLNEVIMGKKRLLRQMSQVSLQAEARLGRPYEDPVPTIRSLSSTLGASCPYPGIDESRWLAYVHQRDVVQGKKQFNVSAAHGIRFLINRAILPNPDAPVPPTQRLHHQLQCAHAIATFLINEYGVSMTSVGRLLGQSHEFSRMVLKEYVAQLHLGPGVPLDHAVRAFLARVRLPGDQDAMDRIADEVARGWWEQNAMSTRVLPVRTQSPMMPGGAPVPPGGQYGQHQHQPHQQHQQQPPAPPPRSRSPLHSITAALASLRNRAGSGASTMSTMTHHSLGRGGHHEPITLGLSHWWWTLPVAVALTGALFKLHVEAIAGMIKRGNRQQRKAFVGIVAKDLDRAVPGLAEDQGLANALKAVYDDAVSIPGAVSGDNEFFALYMYFQEMERALQVEYESLFASSLGEGEQVPPRSPTSPLVAATSPTSPMWSHHPYSTGTASGSGHTSSSPTHSFPRSATPDQPMLMRCMPSFASAASASSRNSTSSSRVVRGPARHTSLDPPMSVASMSVAGAGTGPNGHSSSYIPMSPAYASSDLSVADSTSKRSALGRSKDSMVSAWKKMKRKLSTSQQQQHHHDYLQQQEHHRPSHLATTHGRPVTRFPPTAEE
ncbi:hypothetical protein BCR44DRAFT_1081888 [Catenaria anguillulae PL171]|uniref:SEC7 domain-containing protein n=1 Tax=Catenaria anguillulae PL171 TaxID=765915 RepID=A0A1Y2HNE7_9FUNG|nr:hypothetical protein BCR44DRAFT_1081888 [Catenaria anguillulae PL171]